MEKKFILFTFCFLVICPFFILAVEKVEINTASLQQLDTITGVGPAIAQRIVDARPFSSVDDLLRVKGIGEKTLQKIKEQGLAYVSGQSSPPPPIANQTQNTEKPVTDTNPTPITQNPTPATIYPDGVFINEILPTPDGPDEINEFIELRNINNFEVDLSDWKLQDIEGTITTYIFPKDAKISANGYLVLKRPETKITLNDDKDGLNLIQPDGKIINSVSYITALKNQSYNMQSIFSSLVLERKINSSSPLSLENKINSGWNWSTILTPDLVNIITIIAPKTKTLSKAKKSDINIATGGYKTAPSTASVLDAIIPVETSNSTNPWFLFIISVVIIIISGGILLFFKLRFKK